MDKNEFLLKQLLYRSNHRGTKEMDLLLGGFFKKNYLTLNESEIINFEEILNFTDKELTDYFVMNIENEFLSKMPISQKIKNYKIV